MPSAQTIALTSQNKFIPISAIIELMEVKGLNQAQTAKVLGCSKPNISNRLKALDYTPGYLKSFKDNRADVLSALQAQIVKHVTPDKLQKASAYQLVGMMSLLHNQERLERGQSTENIAYADMSKAQEIVQNNIKAFESKYGIKRGDSVNNAL